MKTVKITTDGRIYMTKIVDAETGAEIKGVQRVEIDISAGTLCVTAKVSLLAPAFEGQAAAEFQMLHPKTGEPATIRSITFAGGETVEF